ncbi:hypothetical protein OBO34_07260 [Clostridiales Family XIII bacterium ASD5510]|uniref:Uncharacterized protein n=2 Tax=Bacteria TaxID=2 RepID=A0A9J6QTY4_9FIRM|nr:hypothetical protein [Hominibacterium faecale]MCU7378151.1 hypothetical protein [Hominibacterium faecale]
MKELIKQVEQLVHDELHRANKKFPLFNSTHEGLAVIQEELWEAENELKGIGEAKENLDRAVYLNVFDTAMLNKLAIIDLDKLQERAVKSACELIQAAAMCEKFKLSLDIKEKREEE